MQRRFRVRTGPDSATEFIRKAGIPISDNFLTRAASHEEGPKYSVICGRCLYQDADLLAWIEAEAAKQVVRKPRGRAARKHSQAGAQ
jgi:hypothetical protein